MMIVSAIAFLKIDDEPITKKILHFINFHSEDKNYTWQKEELLSPSKENDSKPELIEREEYQVNQDNKDTKKYTYLKTDSAASVSIGIKNTKISKLNAAKKAIEFKNK